MTSELLRIENAFGRAFNVRVVGTGDRYGRDDCLVNEKEPLVEFYDASQSVEKFGPRGQFVSRYKLSTLRRSAEEGRGIALRGAVFAWQVSASNVAEAVEYASGTAASR